MNFEEWVKLLCYEVAVKNGHGLKNTIRKINELQNHFIANLRGLFLGLELFCKEVGLNYDDVLETLNITNLEWIEVYLLLPVEASKEFAEEIKKEFYKYWRLDNDNKPL